MNLDDPIVEALIKLFAKHNRFFYDLYDGKFRLIVNWLTEDWSGYGGKYLEDTSGVPWYAHSNTLYHLAQIFKVSPGAMYKKIMQLEKDKEEKI